MIQNQHFNALGIPVTLYNPVDSAKAFFDIEYTVKCSCHLHAYVLSSDASVPMIDMAFWHQCMDNIPPSFVNRLKFAWRWLTRGTYYNDQMVVHASRVADIYNFGVVVHVLGLLLNKAEANNDFDDKCLQIYQMNRELGLDMLECLKNTFDFVESYVNKGNVWLPRDV